MELFNFINARKINDELNIFKGIFDSYIFFAVLFFILVFQVIIMEALRSFFKVQGQTWEEVALRHRRRHHRLAAGSGHQDSYPLEGRFEPEVGYSSPIFRVWEDKSIALAAASVRGTHRAGLDLMELRRTDVRAIPQAHGAHVCAFLDSDARCEVPLRVLWPREIERLMTSRGTRPRRSKPIATTYNNKPIQTRRHRARTAAPTGLDACARAGRQCVRCACMDYIKRLATCARRGPCSPRDRACARGGPTWR